MSNNPFQDNNPFQPSLYENKNAAATINVPSYDFYPSNNSYNQGTSSGGFGNATTSSSPRGYGFGEDPPAGGGAIGAEPAAAEAANKSILSHPVWTWNFWQSFFDVDTSEVLRRMFFSFAPWPRYLKSESVDVFIGAKPDLYGPFWISSTLVFVIAVLGNIASYFQNFGECLNWNYDFHKVTAAAVSIFLYVWLLPILIWTFLWWRNSHGSLKLSGALCLYGYSMSLYIPVSFLWLIHIVWLQWVFALTAATLSGFILAYVFWNHLHFNHTTLAVLTGLMVFFLHLGLGFGFVSYFFQYTQHAECIHPVHNSTDTYSTFHSAPPLNFSTVAESAQMVGNATFSTAPVATTLTMTFLSSSTSVVTGKMVVVSSTETPVLNSSILTEKSSTMAATQAKKSGFLDKKLVENKNNSDRSAPEAAVF